MKPSATILLFAATALTACSKSSTSFSPEDAQIPIQISSGSRIQTRVLDNLFEENDEIGLFVLQQPNAITDERHADNLRFTYLNGTWVPEQTSYYPSASNACDFIAYYPYTDNALPPSSSTMECQTAADQSQKANYSHSDFLVAERNGITPSTEAVALVFKHRMAEIHIEINPGGIFNSPEELLAQNPVITLKGVCTQGQYNLSDKTFSDLENRSDIIPYGELTVTDGKLIGKRAIVIPQEIQGNQPFIQMQVNGKAYNFTFGEDHAIRPATKETYTLTMKGSAPQTYLEAEIDDWENESHMEGELQEHNDNGNYRFSIPDFSQSAVYKAMDGNQPVAEICKEYLNACAAQAIIVYPIHNGTTDLGQGYVAQIFDASTGQLSDSPIHGGTAAWDEGNNTVDYQQGTSAASNVIYMNEGGISLIPSGSNTTELTAEPCFLHDERDGKSYRIVKIGTQYWMSENLAATQFNNGEGIPNLQSEALWTTAIENAEAAYSTDNGHHYYTYAAAQGDIAPEGWMVPRSDDWDRLAAYIGEDTSLITIREGSSNLTGLSIEGTGYRDETGKYPPHTFPTTYMWGQGCTYRIDQDIRMLTWKSQGNTIRCIRE